MPDDNQIPLKQRKIDLRYYIYENKQSPEKRFNVWSDGIRFSASHLPQLAVVYYNEYGAPPYLSEVPSDLSSQPHLTGLESEDVGEFNKYLKVIPKLIDKIRLSETQKVYWRTIADILEEYPVNAILDALEE